MNFLDKLKPVDVLAAILFMFLFALKFYGMDGIVDSSIALVIGYYFGRQNRPIEERKKKK